MKFNTYMEQYKNKLTTAKSLQEMINEAKSSHRIQKLLVAYMMKDKVTFNSMVGLSYKDNYALKLVCHAKITLDRLKDNGYYNSYQMEVLVDKLRDNVKSFDLNCLNDIEPEKWELEGYFKMLNNFVVQEKMESIDVELQKSIDNVLNSINFDNLIVSNF